MLNLKGVGVALVTPFNEQKEINFTEFENVVNYVIEGGVDVESHGWAGVTETSGDGADVGAVGDEVGGGGVAEVVEAHTFEAVGVGEPPAKP